MLLELGHPASALGVAQIYRGLAKVFVLDRQDMALKDEIEALGMKVSTTDTVMNNLDDKARLARHLLEPL
jgi:LPPG:FO 2-phospho-L-lactate transferase